MHFQPDKMRINRTVHRAVDDAVAEVLPAEDHAVGAGEAAVDRNLGALRMRPA